MRSDPPSPVPTTGESGPARLVGWLGGLGAAAAGYGVFQFLFEVLPDIGTGPARYLLAGVSGLGTAATTWLAAALVRARARTADLRGGAGARRTTAGGYAAQRAPGVLPELLASAHARLVEQVSTVDDPVRGPLIGWPHSLGEPHEDTARPTSVGTAYGLHLMLDLGVPDGRLRTGELVETLWRLRLPDGGWSARSQGSRARPEVTALVLGALARAGVPGERLAAEVERCEAGFTHELDRAGRALTHVVTTVLRGLLRASPGSAAIPVLRDALVAGAVSDPDRRHRRCWSHRLSPLPWPSPAARPSPAHTAQAVVALDRVARVRGEGSAARTAREDGIRWLLACPAAAHDGCPDLANLREEVRRPHPDDTGHHEVLNVRHFTAAWVLRALLTPGARELAREEGLEREWQDRLNGAAAAVWAGQTDGIWSWTREGTAPTAAEDLHQPMWMTYQGLSALRAHAVWMYQPNA